MGLIDDEVLDLMHGGALTACHWHMADLESELRLKRGAESTAKVREHLRRLEDRLAHWREIERRIPALVEAIRRAGVGVGD